MKPGQRQGWLRPAVVALIALPIALAGVAGPAAADRVVLKSRDGVRVILPDGAPKCAPAMVFVVESAQPELFSGELTELQRIVGGLRAIIGIECPTVERFALTGVVGEEVFYAGRASADGGWRLEADESAIPGSGSDGSGSDGDGDGAGDGEVREPPVAGLDPTGIRPREPRAGEPPKPVSSGSGFFVSREGHFVTNHHVVDGCRQVTIETATGLTVPGNLIGTNERLDLAVLWFPNAPAEVARFRAGTPIRPGEDVVVVGFPFATYLASQHIVTGGMVSATAGIGDDPTVFQMTAEIQPGNSGGPVFDRSGRITGVVVSQAHHEYVAERFGSLPQNINFAVKELIVKAFLDGHRVDYEVAVESGPETTTDIATAAEAFTFQVLCWK